MQRSMRANLSVISLALIYLYQSALGLCVKLQAQSV